MRLNKGFVVVVVVVITSNSDDSRLHCLPHPARAEVLLIESLLLRSAITPRVSGFVAQSTQVLPSAVMLVWPRRRFDFMQQYVLLPGAIR
jgi:hypothetical protein